MLDEWAYARLYRSNASRLAALRDGSTPTIANVPTPRSEESHRSHGWRQRGWEPQLVHDLHVADQAACEDLELRNLPGSNLHPSIAHERPPRIETRLSAESGGYESRSAGSTAQARSPRTRPRRSRCLDTTGRRDPSLEGRCSRARRSARRRATVLRAEGRPRRLSRCGRWGRRGARTPSSARGPSPSEGRRPARSGARQAAAGHGGPRPGAWRATTGRTRSRCRRGSPRASCHPVQPVGALATCALMELLDHPAGRVDRPTSRLD